MKQIAPAGTPISLKDLTAWLKSLSSPTATLRQYEEAICQYFGIRHCFFLSTGRAAMVVLLQALAESSETKRDKVVIPSYTCFSVPSSIIKAGLKVKVCDINPETLDYDYQKLAQTDFSEVLCIISANLYGIPNNLDKLEKLARENGIHMLDDAAQCMGGQTADGRFAGTFGDAGLFSLDKGKVITSMNGGIIVTNSDQLASKIKSEVELLNPPSFLWLALSMPHVQ